MNLFWHKLSANKKINLNSFRNTEKNNIFANWSPYSKGLLYYNFFFKDLNIRSTFLKSSEVSRSCALQFGILTKEQLFT